MCEFYSFSVYNECNEAGLVVELKCDSLFPFSRRASAGRKGKEVL
jgi:hypothetical protein